MRTEDKEKIQDILRRHERKELKSEVLPYRKFSQHFEYNIALLEAYSAIEKKERNIVSCISHSYNILFSLINLELVLARDIANDLSIYSSDSLSKMHFLGAKKDIFLEGVISCICSGARILTALNLVYFLYYADIDFINNLEVKILKENVG